jgi:hypothetical protein
MYQSHKTISGLHTTSLTQTVLTDWNEYHTCSFIQWSSPLGLPTRSLGKNEGYYTTALSQTACFYLNGTPCNAKIVGCDFQPDHWSVHVKYGKEHWGKGCSCIMWGGVKHWNFGPNIIHTHPTALISVTGLGQIKCKFFSEGHGKIKTRSAQN